MFVAPEQSLVAASAPSPGPPAWSAGPHVHQPAAQAGMPLGWGSGKLQEYQILAKLGAIQENYLASNTSSRLE